MQPPEKTHIVIIGAGLAGCFLAVLLAKRNYHVTVYEKMSREETLRTSQRSINISFHDYLEKAFKTAGIWKAIKKDILSLEGSVTKLPHYRPILASFRDLKIAYYSARRENLIKALIEKADHYSNLKFQFSTSLIHVDKQERKIIVENVKTKKQKTVKPDIVIGADGVHSLTRAYLQQGQQTEHRQMHTGWEYKQISFPKDAITTMPMHSKRAYSSTRKKAIFVALPNKDGTFSGMLALPRTEDFSLLDTDEKVTAFITNIFPELIPGLPYILPALKKNPNGSFITMKTFPWVYKDFMAIVGDAAHSVTPFIGHGVTVGIGDCLGLIRYLDMYKGNWEKTLQAYQADRKQHADIIVDMSLESFSNFQRERKANYGIIYAKLESVLHRILPKFISASTFERIVFDPDFASQYMETHRKQRRKLRFLGVPLLVRVTTAGILFGELTQQKLSEVLAGKRIPASV